MQNLENILAQLIQQPTLFAQFLNTLSLLEYIGARKILKSQAQEQMDEELLAHTSEEIRHALVLKRAAKRVSPDAVSGGYIATQLLAPAEAMTYFKRVDQATPTLLGETNPSLCYLYTTYLVEVRALMLYATIDDVLKKANKPPIFKGILTEEDKHLSQIQAQLALLPDAKQHLAKLQQIEDAAFIDFMTAVSQALRACRKIR